MFIVSFSPSAQRSPSFIAADDTETLRALLDTLHTLVVTNRLPFELLLVLDRRKELTMVHQFVDARPYLASRVAVVADSSDSDLNLFFLVADMVVATSTVKPCAPTPRCERRGVLSNGSLQRAGFVKLIFLFYFFSTSL